MKKYILILFAFIAMSYQASIAQKAVSISDTLAKLQALKEDSDKLKLYVFFFNYYEYSNVDSGTQLMMQGLMHFSQNRYKPGMAMMLACLGGIYSSQNLLQVAEQSEQDALNLYIELKNKQGIALSHNTLGVIEGRRGNFVEACNHFLIALDIYKDSTDTSGIADTYLKLGTANDKSGKYGKALEYYYKALEYYKNGKVDDVLIFIKNNIGSAYMGLQDTDRAIQFYFAALNESSDKRYDQIRMLPLQNLAGIYLFRHDISKSIAYYNSALAIATKEHLEDERAEIMTELSTIYAKKQFKTAEALLDSALLIAEQINSLQLKEKVLQNLADLYRTRGKYKEAYNLLRRSKEQTDSLLANEEEKANTNIETKYNLDHLKLKLQQDELEQQKHVAITRYIFIIASFVCLVLFVTIYFYRKTEQLNRNLIVQKANLEKAVNVKDKLISIIAHDFLGTIGFMPLSLSLCRKESLPTEDRNELLQQLEVSAATSFQTLQNLLDWGKSQMRGMINHPVFFTLGDVLPDILRFITVLASNKNIEVDCNVDSGLKIFADLNQFKFILRNLLANAVKYTERNGLVELSHVSTSDGTHHIVFCVKDNGVGIAADRLCTIFNDGALGTPGTENESSNGIGLQLCKEFVALNGGRIWAESEEGKGSSFFFTMNAG